eukprot:gene837-5717_t
MLLSVTHAGAEPDRRAAAAGTQRGAPKGGAGLADCRPSEALARGARRALGRA